ncbi:MAG: hypothetical protein HY900_14720 [Deltaproteobacteria bacterium]|nr:hypothetical protein [Deltaproteobacteria bacterium]
MPGGTERAVRFRIGADQLIGILHEPTAESARGTGVVFATGGIRTRIGPYGQYLRYARELCRQGFHCLRVDAPGVGDSEGEFHDLLEYWQGTVENCELSNRLVDFLVEQTGVQRIGVLGLCGGAVNAFIAGGESPRVSFAVVISLPVEMPGGAFPEGASVYQEFAGRHSIAGRLEEAFPRYRLPDRRALFLFGDQDPFYSGFMGRYSGLFEDSGGVASPFTLSVVPGADRVFAGQAWQEAACRAFTEWLLDQEDRGVHE